MRDYNQINHGKFRSPTKQPRGPSKNSKSNSSAASSSNHSLGSSNHSHQSHYSEEKKTDDSTSSNHNNNTNAALVNSPKESTAGSSYSTAPSTPPLDYRAPALSAETTHMPSTGSSASSPGSMLSAADALSVRREGAEATILKLRQQLDQKGSLDNSQKSALAKSDAVILELRSQVRQYKRQLEQQAEGQPRSVSGQDQQKQEERMGELQVQLDRAHAQILTADMVRKELEDTLEAEQYTWELRVQDQERQIHELTVDCAGLVGDLEKARDGWKKDQEAWEEERKALRCELDEAKQQTQATASTNRSANEQAPEKEKGDLEDKVRQLELERSELQSCLDEALKELEALDAELRKDEASKNSHNAQALVEPLQHLHRLVLEHEGVESGIHDQNCPAEPRAIIQAISNVLDDASQNPSSPTRSQRKADAQRLKQLEAECSVLKGDLQAREESSAELRSSLKEAVSLLKPLQDAVAKADREKARLQQQHAHQTATAKEVQHYKDELDMKHKECERLRQDVTSLELQLTKAQAATATSLVQNVVKQQKQGGLDSSEHSGGESKARARLRAKRQEEEQLRTMMESARNRFRSLHQQNEDLSGANTQLQAQLESPRDLQSAVQSKMTQLQEELSVTKGELAQKQVEVRNLERELEEAQQSLSGMEKEDRLVLDEANHRVQDLEKKLQDTLQELKSKQEAEKALNKSLKEALNLLRPLQMHLEDAEHEKKQLAAELDTLRKRMGGGANASTASQASEADLQHVRDLEYAISQLEKENSQLHEALEDMSQSINAASHMSGHTNHSSKKSSLPPPEKVQQELVEAKSRYEVTQSRLQDAMAENHTLTAALKERDQEEERLVEEIAVLKRRLNESSTSSGQPAPPPQAPSSTKMAPKGSTRRNPNRVSY